MKKPLYPIIKDDKFVFINHAGEIPLPPRYSVARGFSEGLAAVCIDSKWGLIDTYGEIVVKPDFSERYPRL